MQTVKAIYLAASYLRRRELCGYASQLRAMNHDVTASWLWVETEQVADDGLTLSGHKGALGMLAVMDYRDIDASDLVIVFTDPVSVSVRGGYLQEAGYAQGRRIPLVVVGALRTLAMRHPNVRHFDTWEECLAWLKEE